MIFVVIFNECVLAQQYFCKGFVVALVMPVTAFEKVSKLELITIQLSSIPVYYIVAPCISIIHCGC